VLSQSLENCPFAMNRIRLFFFFARRGW
jgi:hypothetical protein